jgi:hypothetical protein
MTVEKNLLQVVENMSKLVEFQKSTAEFMQAQLEANELLAKRLREAEAKIAIIQGQQHIVDVISNLNNKKQSDWVNDEGERDG